MRTQSRRRSPLMRKLWATTILAGLAGPGMALAADPVSGLQAAYDQLSDTATAFAHPRGLQLQQ